LAKVVRAFSLDTEVAQAVDRIAEKYSTWEHRPNKSRVVNQALRWYYMETDIAFNIEMYESQAQYWQDRCTSKQGVKHHLRELLKCLNPFLRRKRE